MAILNFITKTETLKPIIRNSTINTNLPKRISPDLYATFSNLNFAGVYRIGAENDKRECYIGSAYNISLKITHHLNLLYRGEHHSKELQDWVNKNGLDNIDVSVLKWCKPNLDERENWEQYFLNIIKPKFNAILNKKDIKYEVSTNKPILHYNSRTLNKFNYQIVSRISDASEHTAITFIKEKNMDNERFAPKPTKIKKNWSDVEITEMPVVRRNIGFNVR